MKGKTNFLVELIMSYRTSLLERPTRDAAAS